MSVLRDDFKWDGYRLHFAPEQITKMSNRVVPTQTIDAIKQDPDDNRILLCAIAAGSSVIVTYDRDLLRLGEYGGIKIIRTVDFVRREMAR